MIKGAAKQPDSDRPTVTPQQVAEIAGQLADKFVALAWTAAVAGLREGELFALERRDVDLLHKTVSVTKQAQTVAGKRLVIAPKSREGVRTVSVPDFLASALEQHLAAHVGPEASALVFTNTLHEGHPSFSY
ncbi:MAG: hypothetical protein M1435_03855 [Actinobacteria bacterium]|nr:hypothetical protein [Actinomycetota bacterium]